MRQWTALAPYNAGHVMRMSGPPDIERWRAALTAVLKTIGLTEPVLIELSTLALDEKINEDVCLLINNAGKANFCNIDT